MMLPVVGLVSAKEYRMSMTSISNTYQQIKNIASINELTGDSSGLDIRRFWKDAVSQGPRNKYIQGIEMSKLYGDHSRKFAP